MVVIMFCSMSAFTYALPNGRGVSDEQLAQWTIERLSALDEEVKKAGSLSPRTIVRIRRLIALLDDKRFQGEYEEEMKRVAALEQTMTEGRLVSLETCFLPRE
jgi:hypothetical protein